MLETMADLRELAKPREPKWFDVDGLWKRFQFFMSPWRVAVWLTAVMAVFSDISSYLDPMIPVPVYNYPLAGLGFLLLLACRPFPKTAGTALILFSGLTQTMPWELTVSGYTTGIALVLARLAYERAWWLLALCVLVYVGTDVYAYEPQYRLAALIYDLILVSAMTLLGYFIGRARRETLLSKEAADYAVCQAREDQAQFRNTLAQDLHDSLAADLTRLSLITQNLAGRADLDTEIRSTLQLVSRQSRDALADLRVTIKQLKTPVDEKRAARTLLQVLEDSRNVLLTEKIDLQLYLPAGLESELNRYECIALQMLVTETTTNMVKYAHSGTTAEIAVEIVAGSIEFMSTNVIAEESAKDYAMSSGLGLSQMRAYLERRGGTLEYLSNNGMWLLHAKFPRSLEQEIHNALSPAQLDSGAAVLEATPGADRAIHTNKEETHA